MRPRWVPLTEHLESVAREHRITPEVAWLATKKLIGDGNLPATCIDDRRARVTLEPHWIEFIAQRATTEPRPDANTNLIEASAVPPQLEDMREGDMVWFDRRTAIERRINAPPPIHGRDILVSPQQVRQPDKQQAIASYIEQHYPDGIPQDLTHKELARQIERVTGLRVSERTVQRALGGK